MSEILLVHGSGHGAWCWRDTIPALQALGHSVRAIDLPSHGDDPTPPNDVTLDSYAQAIVTALNAVEGPVVVVGHSMAGFPITAAAELAPEKIARLIYLCAYAPRDGMALSDMRAEAPRQPLLPAIRKSADGKSFTFDLSMVEGLFYHDCPEGTVDYAAPRLCAQAILPQATKIALSARSTGVPKTYIRCDDDRTIPPEYQRTMTLGWPDEDVFALPSSHSPFFAMPERLAHLIDDITTGKA